MVSTNTRTRRQEGRQSTVKDHDLVHSITFDGTKPTEEFDRIAHTTTRWLRFPWQGIRFGLKAPKQPFSNSFCFLYKIINSNLANQDRAEAKQILLNIGCLNVLLPCTDMNHFVSILTQAVNNTNIIHIMQAHPDAMDHLFSQFFISWLQIQHIITATNWGDGHQN